MTASGFAMSERRVGADGYRVIRPGTPLVATEYCTGGRCVQMAGEGPEVREKLKGGRDG
ncbi:hypothetical protein GGR45_003123 [Sphingomonas zeae]|nr:hypothetical protein [Sphingomonas zeae]